MFNKIFWIPKFEKFFQFAKNKLKYFNMSENSQSEKDLFDYEKDSEGKGDENDDVPDPEVPVRRNVTIL